MRTVLLLLFLNALWAFSSSSLQAQSPTGDLKERKISISVSLVPLGDVFRQIIYESGISIGLERSILDGENTDFEFETNRPVYLSGKKKTGESSKSSLTYQVQYKRVFNAKARFYTLYFQNAPLSSVLNALVRQMPNYKWEIIDDVVNIYPTIDRDKRLAELLETTIEGFSIGNNAPKIIIQTELYDLPEVKGLLERENLAVSSIRRNAQDLKAEMSVGVSLKNLPFRRILNILARQKGGGWAMRVRSKRTWKNNEVLEIDI
jgi:hypothetical protein